jgi:hypothetical protein
MVLLGASDTLPPCFRSRLRSGSSSSHWPGWINQQQRDVIDYLREENRVLREQLGHRRVRFTDDQRVRLATKTKKIGRRVLTEIGTLVTLDTLLAWHRHLIARKYDSHPRRGPPGQRDGRDPHLVRMASENRALPDQVSVPSQYSCVRGPDCERSSLAQSSRSNCAIDSQKLLAGSTGLELAASGMTGIIGSPQPATPRRRGDRWRS